MADSKVGSILLLISGIITIFVGLIVLVIGIFVVFDSPNEGMSSGIVIVVLLLVFILVVVLGILKFWASSLMKKPETTAKGGIVALILGIVTGGDIFAITGGILGLLQSEQEPTVSV